MFICLTRGSISMPNILDIPMKKTQSLSISSTVAEVVFTARKAKISIKSELNKGIQINSRFKSEQTSIGINDNYLASVTYRRRSFPIWIVLGVFSFIVGLTLLFSAGTTDDGLMITGTFLLGFSIVFIGLFFYTRIARISFRLADEQDYDVLLGSSAVKNSELMEKFIQKMLMNSMNVEENIQTITLEEQLMTPKTEVAEYQPPAQVQAAQPVQQIPAPPTDSPQTQTVTPATQAQPAVVPASTMGEDITWGQG